MTANTEIPYRIFSSWDEVSPGDKLLWICEDKYMGTAIEFTSYQSGSPFSLVHGKTLEVPEDEAIEDYTEDGWSVAIYPEKYDGIRSLGWAIEENLFKYDPTQAGDTDEDI